MRLSTEDRQEITELRGELTSTRKELVAARSERDEARDSVKLADELVELKKKLVTLQIEEDRIKEQHARERRDIEHKVGLERSRQEQELDLAGREATIKVREENLTADRERFEQQMAFTTTRFENEVGYSGVYPVQIVLASTTNPIEPERVEESPLDWLDRRVDELCDWAA